MELSSSKKVFPTLGDLNFTARALERWMMCGIAVKKKFYRGRKHKVNSTLLQPKLESGGEITNKLAEEWRGKLEEDSDVTYPGKWLGLYEEGKEDPALVVRCVSEFTPPCFQLHNLTLPIPTKCYTVGKYSRCLREWEHPEGEVKGFSMRLKLFTPIEALRLRVRKREKK